MPSAIDTPGVTRRDLPQHNGPYPPCYRALTLLELLMVMVIIGVITSIAVPRFAGAIANQRVEGAARRVVVDLALARRHAKTSTTSQTVSFNTVTNSYRLIGMTHPDHPDDEYKVWLSEEPYNATIVSAAFGGDAEIIFDGWGAPDSGGSVVVQVGSRQKTIDVDPDTGQVSVP